VVLVLAAVLGSACVGSGIEATMIGPARPAREVGCSVRVVFADKAPYPHVDIASVRADCAVSGRYGGGCLAALQDKACALGGDTIYGMSEVLRDQPAYSEVSATVAARTDRPPPRAVPRPEKPDLPF